MLVDGHGLSSQAVAPAALADLPPLLADGHRVVLSHDPLGLDREDPIQIASPAGAEGRARQRRFDPEPDMNSATYRSRKNRLASSSSVIPARRNPCGSRPCQVWSLRSMRPRACFSRGADTHKNAVDSLIIRWYDSFALRHRGLLQHEEEGAKGEKVMPIGARQHRLFAGLLACFCFTAGLFGQVERGTIAGTVTDSSMASTAGVEITVSNVATGVEFKTTTSAVGQFVAPNLIPGEYRLVATAPGFKTVDRAGLIVRANQRLSVDLILEVGDVTERVEVTSTLAPLLTKDSATVSTVLETQQVTELPTLDRTMFNLAGLMAGVTISNTQANSINIPDNARVAMGINANGLGSSAINNFTLDGVNNTQVSATSSYQGVLPPIEAIQEFTIDSSNASAEQGRGGTSIRVTLKSGTNNLHGSLFEFHRNSALNARNFFDRKNPGSDREKPNYIQNQFGFTLGGPIRKDKTFFFGDYQGTRQREGRSWVSTTASSPLRAGDFSGTSQPIYDPATWDATSLTRQQFPGNRIPTTRFSRAALNVLKYAAPERPGRRGGQCVGRGYRI